MEKNDKTMVKKNIVHIYGGQGGGFSGELDLIHQNDFFVFYFPYLVIETPSGRIFIARVLHASVRKSAKK